MPAIQLRFQVPPAARRGVRRAITARAVRRIAAPVAWPIGVHGQLQRHERSLATAHATVLIALEEGVLSIDGSSRTVCDLTFELQQGPLDGLIGMAARWVQRYGLWLDVRGPGDRARHWLPQTAAGHKYEAPAPKLRASMGSDAALRILVANCLEQALPHAADLASEPAAPENVHQIRTGLRRLRALLRCFSNWSSGVDPAWLVSLGPLFEQLGRARDRDTVAALQLQITAAGAPPYTLPDTPASVDPSATVRSRAFTLLMLQLIGFAYGEPRADMALRGKLRRRARARIARLHRRVWFDAGLYAGLDDTQRHLVRKRIKRLRYCLEGARTLFPERELRAYLQRLRRAQDALGAFNDLQVADAHFQSWVAQDTRMWFALGWLRARRDHLLPEVLQVLTRMRRLHRSLPGH